MNGDSKRKEVEALQADLARSGLSRRAFMDRLKGLGVGFGAAFILGVNKIDAHAKGVGVPVPADGISLQSNNPAVDAIISGERGDWRAAGMNGAEGTKTAANEYDRYAKYDRYDKYEKYDRYDKYEKYDRYDRYEKYDRYDRYEKYDRYDKYDRYSR